MAPQRVAVAASGGLDSTALLHCTLRQAERLGVEVTALHVHHGLMPQANAWLAQVRAQARRWGAGFLATRLLGSPERGESVEAWARRERYIALTRMAADAGCRVVLLAHHRRDQAETWLLQALRGAGPAGLAAMPMQAERGGLVWARPWLDQPREAIEAYARRHRLKFAQDASNGDARFARSRLRLEVWPALTRAFADAEVALAAAARRAQQARLLAVEAAAADLPALLADGGLSIAAWRSLPPARARNALRAWLDAGLDGGVTESLLARLGAELPQLHVGRWPVDEGTELRLHRGVLQLAHTGRSAGPWLASGPTPVLNLGQPGETALPDWRGRLRVTAVNEQGIAPERLQQVQARPRTGGERFRLAPQGAARSLKKQYQARALAPWDRDGPLLYDASGELIFAPGLGVEAGCWAPRGAPQLALAWLPGVAAPATGHRQRAE